MDVFIDSQHVTSGPSKVTLWYMSAFKTSIIFVNPIACDVGALQQGSGGGFFAAVPSNKAI
jgi:hypothetical protein